ncbi:MAG: hypothetical protein Q8Q59_07765 [Luteolibacter sp.]|jgi:hypothetical protein|nr:hypothetical protein [Luteolibacter sp.]
MKSTARIGITLPPELAERLRAIATREHRSITRQIEHFLKTAIPPAPEPGKIVMFAK